MKVNRTVPTDERGITLLITLLLMGVLLGVSTSLINITLKQYQLSGIALASEIAFQAANAGLECALYHDFPAAGVSPFAVPDDGSEQAVAPNIDCMGVNASSDDGSNLPNYSDANETDGKSMSGGEQRFEFTWGSDPDAADKLCSIVSVYKFSSGGSDVPVTIGNRDFRGGDPCPAGSVCTVIQARGYNVPCNQISTSPRVVEREYTQVY